MIKDEHPKNEQFKDTLIAIASAMSVRKGVTSSGDLSLSDSEIIEVIDEAFTDHLTDDIQGWLVEMVVEEINEKQGMDDRNEVSSSFR